MRKVLTGSLLFIGLGVLACTRVEASKLVPASFPATIGKAEADQLLAAAGRVLRPALSEDNKERRTYYRCLTLEAAVELAAITGSMACLDRAIASATKLGIERGAQIPWAWTPDLDLPRTKNYQSELFGSLTYALYKGTGDASWVSAFVKETERVRRDTLRSVEGAALAPRGELPGKGATLLIDAVQEYCARMARTGEMTGDSSYYREALEQYQIHRALLRDPKTGLWSQGRNWRIEQPETLSPGAWSRGHGWLMRGLIGTLQALPKDSPEFVQFKVYLRELADTVLPLQQPDGLWYTLLHRSVSESPLDVSGTAMIATGLSRGWREGWLTDTKYLEAARRAFAILPSYVAANGEVRSVSPGPGPLVSETKYLVKEFPAHNGHGTFAVLFAAAEAARLVKHAGHELQAPDLCGQL